MESSDSPLHKAVKLRHVQLVKKLLEEGASVTTIDSNANTPLHLAFLLKYFEIVDLMLLYIEETSCYDDVINKDGLSHVHIACARGNAQLVYSYDYVGANIKSVVGETSKEYPGYTCLNFACDSKCLETIKVVARAIKLLGHCLDKKKEDFHGVKIDNYGHSMIERHHDGYPFLKEKKVLLSDFQNACFYGNVDEVQTFLEMGTDVNSTMTKEAIACPLFTALHLAVEALKNRQKIVELLLAYGAHVNLRNGFSMTPLHCALYSDAFRQEKKPWGNNPEEDDTLKVLYAAVEDKESNTMDPFGLTYFHAAIAVNDLEMVKKFINNGQADCKPILPNSRNFTMYTPLHFAVKYGHEDLAKLFIELGADVNANEDQNHFDTPLQVAIQFGQCKMIDFLLAHGANAKILTYAENKTVLHLLVERFGNYEDEKPELLRILDTFIRLGVDVNAADSGKYTPLHNACWRMKQARDIIFELLNEGADINALNRHGKVAFGRTFCRDAKLKFEVFLKLYYHVKKVKELGLKVIPENDEFCEMVMKLKEEWCQKKEEWPAIEKICADEELANKQQDWIKEIEKLKVDMLDDEVSLYDYVRMETKDAITFVNNERIKALIADMQFKNLYPVYGYLIPVAHRNSLCLLEPQQPIQTNQNALKSISDQLSRPKDLVPPVFRPKKIVNSNRSSEASEQSDAELPAGISLQDAIKLGNIKWVKELLAKGASTKFTDDEANGPLHLAFTANHEEIVDLLLSHMKENSDYVNFPNDQGITQLHIAALRGDTFVVQKLLDAEANPSDFVNEDSPIYPGYTALQFACDSKNLKTVKALTKSMDIYGNIMDDVEENFGEVSNVAKNSILESVIVKSLYKEERLIEFHQACLSSKKSVADVKQFLSHRVKVNTPMYRNSKRYPLNTALHFVVESRRDRQEKVELLLKHGADVNRKNGFGMTPLHLAAYNDSKKTKVTDRYESREKDDVLEILYKAATNKEANPMDAFGLTYFHIAIALNDLPFVKKMLFRGEDVNRAVLPNVRDFSNYSPLHFAARYGHDEMAKLLIERGAKVYDDNDNPLFNTPLQVAIINGKCQVMHVFLDHGANARVRQSATKKSTLHLVVDRCCESRMETPEGKGEKGELGWLIEKLVKNGAEVDAKDEKGFTPLQLSCTNLLECSELASWLLCVGADINAKARRKTALEMVPSRSFNKNYHDFFMLYHQVNKMKALGMPCEPANEKYCEVLLKKRAKWEMNENDGEQVKCLYGEETMKKKNIERQEEIKKLKKDMLTDKVSMYDFIRMDGEKAAAYLGIERLQKIDGIVAAQTLYNKFGYLIPVVYRKGKKWLEDKEKSQKAAAVDESTDEVQGAKRKRT